LRRLGRLHIASIRAFEAGRHDRKRAAGELAALLAGALCRLGGERVEILSESAAGALLFAAEYRLV
jgi:hypothetical protein